MNDHFLNFKIEDYDKPIYRIFAREWFMQLFTDYQITLFKPKCWEDPYENFILKSTCMLDDGTVFKMGFHDNFYGQCWSLRKESDAMWRIYAPEKNGVKVQTTVRKLYEALYSQLDPTKRKFCFIGKVEYSTTNKLLELLANPMAMKDRIVDQKGDKQASTLLLKRTPFNHEKEVRLIYNSVAPINSDYFRFSIDPIALFDKIVFDPRVEYKTFKTDKAFLKKLGFNKPIVKSVLYKVPQLTFRIDNLH